MLCIQQSKSNVFSYKAMESKNTCTKHLPPCRWGIEYADCSPCRGVRSPRKGAARWPWVETRRVRGRDPGG